MQCDARRGRPCKNCREAVSCNTGKVPCCRFRGVSYAPNPVANASSAKPSAIAHVVQDREYYERTEQVLREIDARLESTSTSAQQGRTSTSHRSVSPPPRHDTMATPQRPGHRHAYSSARMQPPSITHTNSSTAPRPLPPVPNHLAAKAEEAEAQRSRIRADSRRLQDLQDQVVDLKARLELEKRARSAAEERAQLAYDQGYEYAVQKARTWVREKVLARTLERSPQASGFAMQYPTPHHTQPVTTTSPEARPNQDLQLEDGFNGLDIRHPHHSETTDVGDDGSTMISSLASAAPLQPGPVAIASPPAPSLPAQRPSGSRVNAAADPRLEALRERALATTAAFRDRRAAEQWLDQNAHLAGLTTSPENGESATGEKRKRSDEEGGQE